MGEIALRRFFLAVFCALALSLSALAATGVNVGFSPLGYVLGSELVSSGLSVLLIPLAMLMGWFIIDAEPAVHILNKQVEELTSGAISAKAMGLSLSVAVALANGLPMVRVLTGLPILYFLVPGYAVALGLSFLLRGRMAALKGARAGCRCSTVRMSGLPFLS